MARERISPLLKDALDSGMRVIENPADGDARRQRAYYERKKHDPAYLAKDRARSRRYKAERKRKVALSRVCRCGITFLIPPDKRVSQKWCSRACQQKHIDRRRGRTHYCARCNQELTQGEVDVSNFKRALPHALMVPGTRVRAKLHESEGIVTGTVVAVAGRAVRLRLDAGVGAMLREVTVDGHALLGAAPPLGEQEWFGRARVTLHNGVSFDTQRLRTYASSREEAVRRIAEAAGKLYPRAGIETRGVRLGG